uniref:Protein kinase domain-containing protein n=1 Tax=viral metagenome TaxID=1070528 RepID=A0A6C0IJX9_9ZZZZ
MLFTLLKTTIICIKSLFLYKTGLVDYFNTFKTTLTELSQLNVFYTKVIQWVADSHFNDEQMTNFIKNFTNNVHYSSADIDYASLLELYTNAQKNGDTFLLSSMIPLNAGTVSLVFKGELNGKPVVIKMLRVGIKEKLKDAVELFLALCNIIDYIPYLRTLNASKIIGKNIKLLMQQLDFKNEIKNIKIFENAYKKNKNIKVPLVYDYYTEKNNNLIVMEYLDGKTMYELNNAERESYYKTFMKVAMLNYFKYGIIHGDLHSGNIIFMPNNVIGYLDLGIIYVLNTDHQDFLYKFFSNFSAGEYNQLIDDLFDEEIIRTCFIINGNADEIVHTLHIIKTEIHALLKDNKIFVNNTISQTDIFILMNILYKYKLEFNDYISFILLSSISSIGMCARLSNNKMNVLIADAFEKFNASLMFEC